MNLRQLHRKTAPILLIPLFLTALTGIAFRLGRSWFGISEEVGEFFLSLHEGAFLGRRLVPVYVLLIGLGLLGLIVTGLVMLKPRAIMQSKRDWRWWHRVLAALVVLPLIISALTGMGYRLATAWFGVSGDSVKFLLRLHEGAYLGFTLRPFYVLLVGAGLIGLLITGLPILGIFRKPKPQTPPES